MHYLSTLKSIFTMFNGAPAEKVCERLRNAGKFQISKLNQYTKELKVSISKCHGSWVPGPILALSYVCACVCV